MADVSITNAHEAVEVDLWGALYETQRVTRTRQKALTALQDEASALAEAEEGDTDKVVELMAKMLDQLLAPVEGKRKASTLINEKWKADDLTLPELEGFVERLGDASRPT